MAPVKFDDLSKTATEVLNDDYQTSGFQTKAKQKTSWDGAVSTTTVDLWGGQGTQTPSKISWKLPKPFGCSALAVDKLEMDKAGKFKLEVSGDKALHKISDLKVELKSDLLNLEKATVAGIYTGIPDTQVKVEVAPLGFDFTGLEVTRAIDKITLGLKCDSKNFTAPDVGFRAEYGPAVLALLSKQKLSAFSLFANIQARDDLKVAASYEVGGKSSGNFSLGMDWKISNQTSLKSKIQQDGSFSATIKIILAKGFNVLAGGKHNVNNNDMSYGLQVSIE